MKATRIAWLGIANALATIGIAYPQTPTETVIHNFSSFPNGANPSGTLARDAAGDLFGVAYAGGAANLGVVFEYTAAGKYKVLHSFTGGTDGASPTAGVALDRPGICTAPRMAAAHPAKASSMR